jgi:hypothetical protein
MGEESVRVRRAILAVGFVAAIAGAGCASSSSGAAAAAPDAAQRQAAQPVFAGNQAGAWESVLMPGGFSPAGAEASRRDAALSAGERGAILAEGLWPDSSRPSLDQVRRLFLPAQPEFVEYFSAYGWHGARARRACP